MPTIVYPGNDVHRHDFITTAYATDALDQQVGSAYVMGATRNNLHTLHSKFNALITERTSSTGVRRQEVLEKNESLTKLRTYCLHGLASVKNRVERLDEPVSVLANYGIGATGTNPVLSLSSALTTVADQIIAGDAKTVEAGFPAMVNPTAEEIAAINEIAKKEIVDVASADRIVDSAEEELAQVRADVDLLIRDIVSDLNYNLRRSDDASRRRVMRSYGVKFKSGVVAE